LLDDEKKADSLPVVSPLDSLVCSPDTLADETRCFVAWQNVEIAFLSKITAERHATNPGIARDEFSEVL
jgi:hypothetical protein